MSNKIDGLHLHVDGKLESVSDLFSEENLGKLLLKLVQDLDMQLIFGPVFKQVEIEESKLQGDVFQDEGGLSAFCMIGTSHISIHAWPLRKYFSMDIYSCKQFNADVAKATVIELLKPTKIRCKCVERPENLDH